MLEKEYEQLINYVEEMISGDFQLVHAGHKLDWNDTKIFELIAKIREKRKGVSLPKLNPGDQLKNKISKQNMWVINDDGETVFLHPGTPTIKYPLDKILNEFVIVKREKKQKGSRLHN